MTLLEEARVAAVAAADADSAAWAELGMLMIRSSTESREGSDQVRDVERIRDEFAALGDRQGAQYAELVAAFSLFGMGRAAEAAARAMAILEGEPADGRIAIDARRTAGTASVWGPTPAGKAIDFISRENTRSAGRGSRLGIARMLMLQGRFDEATQVIDAAEQAIREGGDRIYEPDVASARGEIARLLGSHREAVALHRAAYDGLVALGDKSYASTAAVGLAEALAEAGEDEEALHFADVAIDTSARDDTASQGGGRAVRGRILSARGNHAEAEAEAREGVAILARTDFVPMHADALVQLAHVLAAAGKTAEARSVASDALGLYRQKGATFFVDRTETLIAEWGG
jgi:tetratricopeptide (TPR) repeat protein